MVGSLARWLRIMGYDNAYPEAGPARALIERARLEDGILLTRDNQDGTEGREVAGRGPVAYDEQHKAANEADDPHDEARATVEEWIGVVGPRRERMFDGIRDSIIRHESGAVGCHLVLGVRASGHKS